MTSNIDSANDLGPIGNEFNKLSILAVHLIVENVLHYVHSCKRCLRFPKLCVYGPLHLPKFECLLRRSADTCLTDGISGKLVKKIRVLSV